MLIHTGIHCSENGNCQPDDILQGLIFKADDPFEEKEGDKDEIQDLNFTNIEEIDFDDPDNIANVYPPTDSKVSKNTY